MFCFSFTNYGYIAAAIDIWILNLDIVKIKVSMSSLSLAICIVTVTKRARVVVSVHCWTIYSHTCHMSLDIPDTCHVSFACRDHECLVLMVHIILTKALPC